MKKLILLFMVLSIPFMLGATSTINKAGDTYTGVHDFSGGTIKLGITTLENGEIISNTTDDQIDLKDDDGTTYMSVTGQGTTTTGTLSQVCGDSGACVNFDETNKIRLKMTGGTYNESIDHDLDSTENTDVVSSASGLNLIQYNGISLKTPSITINGTTNNCTIIVDSDGTCDSGTAMAVDNSIAICAVCAAN